MKAKDFARVVAARVLRDVVILHSGDGLSREEILDGLILAANDLRDGSDGMTALHDLAWELRGDWGSRHVS